MGTQALIFEAHHQALVEVVIFLDTSVELSDQHVAVNTRAPFFLMQEAIQDMRARGGGGSIVNVITTAAHGGLPHLAPYVASKSAPVGLTPNAPTHIGGTGSE